MITRSRKRDGELFWGCSGYPACQGTRKYEALGLVSVSEVLKTSPASAPKAIPDKNVLLRQEQKRILKLIVSKTKSNKSAKQWLVTPMVALDGNTPKQVMQKTEGCKKVEALLNDIFG